MGKKQVSGDKWISLWQNDVGTLTVKMGDGVIVIPLNKEQEVMMISEPSVAYDGLRSLLLPAGELEPDEDPADSANRELQEEIGYIANQLDYLGLIYSSIKYVNAKFHIFLARELDISYLQGDEPEGWIEAQQPVPLSEIEALIATGKLLDSATIASLFMARSFIEKEKGHS